MVFEHISEMSSGIYLDKKMANIAHDLYINQKIKEEFPCDEKGQPLGVFLSTYKELKLKEDELLQGIDESKRRKTKKL